MEKLPSEKNKLATLVNQVMKILIDIGKGAAKTFLVGQIPALGFPVLSQITDGILSLIDSYVYKNAALGSTFVIIDIQTYHQKEAVNKAAAALLKLYETEGTETENAKKARAEARRRLGDLIRWDGSARP